MEMGTLIFDIDGTICTQEVDYSKARPYLNIINKINSKYNEGYKIIFFTARGSETKIDWSLITINQLKEWGVKYHDLYFGKPAGMQYIDDKGINIYSWEPEIESVSLIDKKWGKEYLLCSTEKYSFKRLEINPECNISKQYHEEKHETWHIVEGTGTALINNQIIKVVPGNTIIIPPKTIHQIRAENNKLIIMEASTSELTDIIRITEECCI